MAQITSLATVGSSLPVPSVKELAKETLNTVPQQYLRNDVQDSLFISSADRSVPQIPVIDMAKLVSSHDIIAMESELEKLHCAFKEWGFFQLINHGVSCSILEDVKRGIEDFFNLPMDEIKKFSQLPGDIEGFGQAFVVSEDQKLEWGDIFVIITQPKSSRKPHLFPNLPLSFRDALDAYSTELENMAKTIFGLMEKALGMEVHEITELFEGAWQSMRMNYYPPCPQAESVIGLNPHSDLTGLTILLQVNHIQGLQIKNHDHWVQLNHFPMPLWLTLGTF